MTALACAHVYHDRCLQAVCEAKALNSFWAVTCPLCRHCAQPEGTAEIASDRETVLPPLLDQYKNDLETLFLGDSSEEIPPGQPSQDMLTLRQSRSGSASSSGIVRNDSGHAVDIPCKTLQALYEIEDSATADGADRGKGTSNAKGKAKSKATARKAQKVPEKELGEPEGGGDELAEDDTKKDADEHKLIAAGKSTSKGIGKVKAAGKEQASKSTRKAKTTKPEEKPEDDDDDHAEEEEEEEDDREGDNEEGENDDEENEVDDDETPVASTSTSKSIGKTGKGKGKAKAASKGKGVIKGKGKVLMTDKAEKQAKAPGKGKGNKKGKDMTTETQAKAPGKGNIAKAAGKGKDMNIEDAADHAAAAKADEAVKRKSNMSC